MPVPALPAATIVLMRDAEEGLEVLLLKRHEAAGFAPGAYVFPGGRVDAGDASPALVGRVDGLSPSAAARRLGLADADPPAIAYYLGALREAFEETGILVGVGSDGRAPTPAAHDPETDRVRRELMEDRIGFLEVLERLDCRIPGGAIEYAAHWITPERSPRRFDTRFFAARVPIDATATVDPREMTEALWIAPARAVAATEREQLHMILPTVRTLQQLSAHVTDRRRAPGPRPRARVDRDAHAGGNAAPLPHEGSRRALKGRPRKLFAAPAGRARLAPCGQ